MDQKNKLCHIWHSY